MRSHSFSFHLSVAMPPASTASSSSSSSSFTPSPAPPSSPSAPKQSTPYEDHNEPEPDVPWVAALTTYFGYALLFLFGYIREGARAWLPKAWLPRSFAARGPAGYAPLADDYDDFYTRRLYHRIQDCWGRPISCVVLSFVASPILSRDYKPFLAYVGSRSAAGAWIDVMDRSSSDGNKTLQLSGTTRRCLNLGSYNYLGFAESEADVNERVQQSLLKCAIVPPAAV
jgi:serine palmitoyltransferase